METKHYLTSDLKLQAFLRLMLPASFLGVDKTGDSEKLHFHFQDSTELQSLVQGYYTGQTYTLSPFQLSTLQDQGKAMIFGRARFSVP